MSIAALLPASLPAQTAALFEEDPTGLLPPAQAMRRLPADLQVHLTAGYLALRKGAFFDAIRSLRQAEERQANPYVLKALGVAYYGAGQKKLFALKMNQALALQPEDFAPYYYLGRHYQTDYADCHPAAEYFEKALIRNPGHYRSHYHLGACYEELRRIPAAGQHYRRSLELAERAGRPFGQPYQGLARLHILDGDWSQALPAAQRAVELGPGDASALKLLAQIWKSLGNLPEAVRQFQKAAELDPADATVQYQLFRLYQAAGENRLAEAALQRFRWLSSVYRSR